MNDERGRPIEILMVEDNPGDIRLTQEALKKNKLRNILHSVDNGVDALAYLRKEGKFKTRNRPDLIILDLNIPKKNGMEVLKEVKEDPILRRIPVVILTSSRAEEDIVRGYNLHANCYITKPVDLGKFIEVVKVLEDFWLEIVRLPKE